MRDNLDLTTEIAELFARRWQGLTTPAEDVALEAWLAADPRRSELVAFLHQAWEITGHANLNADSERFRQRMHRVVAPRPSRWRPMAVAAATVLVAGAALVWRSPAFRPVSQPAATYEREYATRSGERATFTLTDGTRLVLAPESRLRVGTGFGGDRREVTLTGEAYFDVKHDARRPFSVRAGRLVAEDLGTQFVVRAYAEDPHATVAVREGLVKIVGTDRGTGIGDSSAAAVLQPGYQGKISADGTPIVRRADTVAAFAWMDGRLLFEDTPLREALPTLARWYDLDIRLADSSLSDWPVTATFRTESARQVLHMLAASLGLDIQHDGRTVTIRRAHP